MKELLINLFSDKPNKNTTRDENMPPEAKQPVNPVWERLEQHETRLQKVEEKTKKIPAILECVKRIERKFTTLIELFRDGRIPAHDCIQKEKMDEFTVQLEKRDQKLYQAFTEIKSNQASFKERLDNKAKKVDKQDETLEKDATDIDTLQVDVSGLKSTMKIVIWVVPLILTAILAIQAINLYWFMQHITVI